MKNIFVVFLLTCPSIFGEEVAQLVISGNNQFTADIYKELSKLDQDNFLFSPFSAETILALAQSGAGGQTGQELRNSVHLPHDQTKIESAFKNLLPTLKSADDIYVLHTANKLYVKTNFTIKDEFKRVATDVFGADLENIEFSRSAEAAKTMNQWVEKQTQDKIHDLITPDKLDDTTAAILINALYLKANWSLPFNELQTGKKDFHQSDKKIVQVDTMHLDEDDKFLRYSENAELDSKFLELPFEGEDMFMGFVLPNDKNGITNLEKQIEKIFAPQNFTREYVQTSIPKFKTETTIDVKKVLQKLGVTKAFDIRQADFSGISDTKLFISDVIQKTFIDVHEHGVEAAAASYIGWHYGSAVWPAPVPKQFHADHPFIYYIKIKNLIVFAGKVGRPTY